MQCSSEGVFILPSVVHFAFLCRQHSLVVWFMYLFMGRFQWAGGLRLPPFWCLLNCSECMRPWKHERFTQADLLPDQTQYHPLSNMQAPAKKTRKTVYKTVIHMCLSTAILCWHHCHFASATLLMIPHSTKLEETLRGRRNLELMKRSLKMM